MNSAYKGFAHRRICGHLRRRGPLGMEQRRGVLGDHRGGGFRAIAFGGVLVDLRGFIFEKVVVQVDLVERRGRSAADARCGAATGAAKRRHRATRLCLGRRLPLLRSERVVRRERAAGRHIAFVFAVMTRARRSGLRFTSCGFTGPALLECGRRNSTDVPDLGSIVAGRLVGLQNLKMIAAFFALIEDARVRSVVCDLLYSRRGNPHPS